jgi:class 3 adenylate cyclase/tetratricopeptide (TPR) repeat protein
MDSIEEERETLRRAISVLESQRAVLGESVVDTALVPLREKLASLQPNATSEQRKLVTVLFADLVGFTAMSEHMDPEDVREIVNAYFSRWSICIEKTGGTVEKFIGDAVMAVFGLTATREDDPESAVRSALAMHQALAELNNELEKSGGQELAMRVGIHTGLVMASFLGERKGQSLVVVGDTVNLASRLQSAAPAGAILISQDTFQHVRGIFDVQILDPIHLKGKEGLTQAYLVMQAKDRSFQMPTRGVEGIETRMIGREVEMQQLEEALLLAVERRRTQIVAVVGEAGIGKSRLISEFCTWAEQLPQDIRFYKGRANPSMQNLHYSLLRNLFSLSFQIYSSDPPRAVQEKIERGIGEAAFRVSGEKQAINLADLLDGSLPPEILMRTHFIGQLLGFPFENSPYLGKELADPRTFRFQAVNYLIDYFKAVASTASIVLLLEDIHWADDSSLEILEQLVEGLVDEPVLVLCTARPTFFERNPGWGEQRFDHEPAFTLVPLSPLSQTESHRLLEEILQKAEGVPASLTSLVISRAEGNPFFMEEVIQMLIEQGVILKGGERWRIDLSQLAEVRIPSTLMEVLQARFDSLNVEEQVLLQRASVLGRIFWDGALGFMEQGKEDQVQLSPRMMDILLSLSAKELVYAHKVSTFENTHEYQFKHAVLRDVTYDSALKRLRRIYHAYAAAWLVTVAEQSHRSDEFAAMIAEHFERAADREKACTWYRRAGIRAADSYANAEAIRCLTRYLDITNKDDVTGRFDVLMRRVKLYDLVANRQAQKQDLEELQVVAEELDAQDLMEGRTVVSRRAMVFLQWWFFYDATGELQASISAAQQATDLSISSGDKENEAQGRLYLGAAFWKQSNYKIAGEHLQRALELARMLNSPKLEADCLRNLGIVAQYQGDFSEAQASYEDALRIYHASGNERGESMVLNSLGSLLIDQGLYRDARAYFEQSLALKRKIGHRRSEHITLHNLGTAADMLGNFSEALDYLEQVQRFVAEMGDRDGEADALLSLAKITFHLGDNRRTEVCLAQALSIDREIGSKFGESEVLAFQAHLAHRLGDHQAAFQLSQGSLALAQELNLSTLQADDLAIAGDALLGWGKAEQAIESYQKALELAGPGKSTRQAYMEIQAGLARAYLVLNNLEKALTIVEEILAGLAGSSHAQASALIELSFLSLEGMNEPFRVLLTCFQVLKALKNPRAGPLLAAASRFLREQAGRLATEPLRRSFLENVPANREILAEMEAGYHSC